MKKVISMFLAVCVLSGCSAFNTRSKKITVTTNVPQSEIFINDKKAGNGTAELSVKKNKSVQIMVTAKGYNTTYRRIDTKISTTGMLDIIGAVIFWLPGIGLFFPGFYKLETDSVMVHLDRAQQMPEPEPYQEETEQL